MVCGLSPLVKQSWVVSGVLLNIMTSGFQLGYTSTLLKALKTPDSPIPLDMSTASWLASCIGPANLIGFFISSILMSSIGRSKTFMLSALPGSLCWILIYCSNDIIMLMIGRIMGGIATGASICLGAVIVGEYTSPKYRGIFLNLKTTAICFGAMVIHLMDAHFHWRTISIFSLVIQLISLAINITWPESPRWLVSKKRHDEAEASFFWLRGCDNEAEQEFKELIRTQASVEHEDKPIISKVKEFFNKFTQLSFLTPTIIVLFGFSLLESSGRHYFPSYAPQIIQAITGDKINNSLYTLGLDLTITISSLFSCVLIRYMKRRTVLFTTGLAAVTVLFGACICTFLQSVNESYDSISWISFSLFVIYFILCNLGCTPIPLALLGEIFPLEHRAAGSAVTGVIISVSLWIGLKITPYLLSSVHIYGTFSIFGLLQVLCLLVLYYILPETKDRTLEEIEYYLKSGCYKEEESDAEENLSDNLIAAKI